MRIELANSRPSRRSPGWQSRCGQTFFAAVLGGMSLALALLSEASAAQQPRPPRAAFPQELAGRWFDDRRACRDPGRNGEDYDQHAVMVITPGTRTGNREFEFPDRAKAVRRVGPGSWQIDSSHTVDGLDPPEIFSTATYTLTREGLTLTREGAASKWVRCR